MTMFAGDELRQAMGVPFFYGLCEAFLVGAFCMGAWKLGWSKAPKDAPLWEILWTSYEVLEAERQDIHEIEVSVSTDSSMDQESQMGNVLTTYFQMENTEQRKASFTMKPPSGDGPGPGSQEVILM